MAKFLFVYRGPLEESTAPPSPEMMQAILQSWGAWFQTIGAALVDGGDGLLQTGKLVDAKGVVSDGPFIEAKEIVGGYSVVKADTYDEAVGYAKSCPILHQPGWKVEVRELAGFA